MLVSVPTGQVTSGHDFSAKICRTPLSRCVLGHMGVRKWHVATTQPNGGFWPGPESEGQWTRAPEMVTPSWHVGSASTH